MNKAILVIDMPKGCMQCPCMYISDYDGECHCSIIRESVEEYGEGKYGSKPKWCPLKEMPSKMPQFFQEKKCFSDKDKGYFQGWNACLKEILGEEE